MTLAFAPFDLSFITFFPLAFMFASWRTLTPGRAAMRGFLFGLGLFGAGVSWVFISVYYFGGREIFSALVATGIFVVFWALFPALTGYLIAKTKNNKVRFQLFLMPGIWVLVEYLRGEWVLNGFPWLQVAYSQITTPLAGYVPIIGVYGTGFIVAVIAYSILRSLSNWPSFLNRIMLILVLVLGGAAFRTIEWTSPIGQNIKISLIQGNISQDRKWAEDNRDATLDLYRSITRKNWAADIIIWPETSIPAYYSDVKETFLKPLESEALEHGADLIVSLPMKNADNSVRYNAVLTLGKTPGIYRKNHLLPFGEYMPLQPVSGYLLQFLNVRLGNFASGGDDQQLMRAAGYQFITSICYEDVFAITRPELLAQAAFLVNVTNDAWFGRSIEPYQHMQIAQMRALETGRYLMRATNTGVTGVVDSKGKIVSEGDLFKTDVISANIVPMQGVTPYVYIGNETIIAIIMLLTVGEFTGGFFQRNKIS